MLGSSRSDGRACSTTVVPAYADDLAAGVCSGADQHGCCGVVCGGELVQPSVVNVDGFPAKDTLRQAVVRTVCCADVVAVSTKLFVLASVLGCLNSNVA